MQISGSLLKVALGATVIMPTVGAMPPVFAQETNQAAPPAKKRTPNSWATGDVTVIDDTTQTFKILDYTSKVVQKQVGDKTIETIERGVERVRTFKLTPQTKVLREERDISADQLRVGDSVSYIATKGHGVVLDTITYTAKVTSVNPLALELKGFKTNNIFVGSDTVAVVAQGDLLLVSAKKPEELKFTRVTELDKSILAVGRSVLVYPSWETDSDADEAARIAVENYRP